MAISVVSAWARATFGESGILTIAALVGVTDIDPFVLNIAQGGVAGMPVAVLSAAVLIAASSNNLAKAAYAIGFGGDRRRAPAGAAAACCWRCWASPPRRSTLCADAAG